jgi:hypothetical protein
MKQKSKHISTIEARKAALKDITKDSGINYVYHEKEILKDIKNNKDV